MTDDSGAPPPANPRLREADITALARFGTRVRRGDGEALFRAGERRGGFFVVLTGSVEILDLSGTEPQRVMVHGPGQFTGDIDIVRRRRSVVAAVARGETELLALSSADARRIIAEFPRLGETIFGAFIARRTELLESGFEGLRVIGSTDSRETFRIREFLARNQVPFTWIDLEDHPGIAELLPQPAHPSPGEAGGERTDLPIVMSGADLLLRNPSIREVAEAVGLRRSFDPEGSVLHDLLIVGAGPAGLGAAAYGASEGLKIVVLEGVAPGGQAGASTRIENYLGFPTGITGTELMSRATLQAQKFGAELSSPAPVTRLDLGGEHPRVHLDSGERLSARCILIATGADYRKLDVPGRERFDGMGVYYAATPIELTACRGNDVVVVGGGNSAGQAVMFLSEHTRSVRVLLRGGDLRKSMSSYLADRIEAAPNVEVLRHTEIREFKGEERLEGVVIEDRPTGERRTLEVGGVFSFIGAVPRTGGLPPEIETDGRGFILTGRMVADSRSWRGARDPFLLETSVPGIFAAGDVRHGSIPRVASAVGDGAMAIKLVHEYLAERSREEPAGPGTPR